MSVSVTVSVFILLRNHHAPPVIVPVRHCCSGPSEKNSHLHRLPLSPSLFVYTSFHLLPFPHLQLPPSTIHLPPSTLRRRIIPNNSLDFPLICRTVLLEQIECLGLRRRVWVGVVQQVLDPEQDLLDCDGGLPAFFFVEDREADGAGGVDVGVEEGGDEFACCCYFVGVGGKG